MRAPDRIYMRVPGRLTRLRKPKRSGHHLRQQGRTPSRPSRLTRQGGNELMAAPRIARVFGAVNIGSFRISAMIAGISETGEMVVLGSGHRAAQGIKRGYVTDMAGRDLCGARCGRTGREDGQHFDPERLDRLFGGGPCQPGRAG
jgi:hypothetical protein